MKRRLLLVFLSLIMALSLSACAYTFKTTGVNGNYHKGDGLKLGLDHVYSYYNPLFYYDSSYEDILDLCYLRLFSKDRNNNTLYNITETQGEVVDGYLYQSPASLKVVEEEGIYKYLITLINI